MFHSLRHLSWAFSIALHVLVLVGGAYVSTGDHMKLNLNKKMYEVNLVGPPHKGKPGAKSAPKQATAPESAPAKAVPKEAPPVKAPEAPKKPEKKVALPDDSAKPLPTANATQVAEAKPEEPKKEEPKKEEPKKEEPKKEEPKKDEKKPAKDQKADAGDSKNATKAADSKQEKKPTKEEILAQALGDASKEAKGTKPGSEGAAKGSSKGGSKDALADALADIGRDVSGRGTHGDGTAEDGEGEGESTGSLEDFYATQVVRAIRQNWRFPRLSNIVLATTVELRVNKTGEILSAKMKNSSGRPDFDASVMRAIEDTKKLPPLPETLGATLAITFYNTDNQ